MDNFEPPLEHVLTAISARSDDLKSPLTALYLRYVTEDLGNHLLGGTPERIPDVANFMQELAKKEGLPNEIIESIGAFSSQLTMEARKALLEAIDQYVEPFDDEYELGEVYLNLQYPNRPPSPEY